MDWGLVAGLYRVRSVGCSRLHSFDVFSQKDAGKQKEDSTKTEGGGKKDRYEAEHKR